MRVSNVISLESPMMTPSLQLKKSRVKGMNTQREVGLHAARVNWQRWCGRYTTQHTGALIPVFSY